MPGLGPDRAGLRHLTLDFSHASTANQQSLDLARSWGDRLRHVHLTDGSGLGQGRAHGARTRRPERGEVLEHLAQTDFDGHVVLEVNTRKADTRAKREAELAESLAFTRLHLGATVHPTYAVDGAGVADALTGGRVGGA